MTMVEDRITRLSLQKRALLDAMLSDRRAALLPADDAERILCAIWSDALGQEVGPLDDFFRLGGDSIVALQLAARSHARGLAVRAAQIFAFPTIRRLAPHVERVVADNSAALPPDGAPQARDIALTPMQLGMLYQVESATQPDICLSQFVCRFPPELDVARMRLAWESLAHRHAALRATVTYGEDGRPFMRIAARMAFRIDVHDWSAWTPAEAARAFDTYAAAELSRGFGVSGDPLMRLAFMRMPDGRCGCVWTHHHLLLDGWSQLVLLRDVFALYRADGHAPVQADDSAAVAAFAVAQPASLAPEAQEYWKRSFAGAMACSFPRAEPHSSAIDIASAALGPGISAGLAAAAARAGVSVAVALEVVWAMVLANLFRRPEPVFGLVVSVRPSHLPGIERLAWLCVNTVPVRLPLRPGQHFGAVLAERGEARPGLQERLMDPLPEILKACPQAGFGSVLVLENFHRGVADVAHALDPVLAPSDVRFRVREHHPLVCVVSGHPRDLHAEIKIDRHWYVPHSAEALMAQFKLAAARLVEMPEQPVIDQVAAIAAQVDLQQREASWRRLAARAGRRG